MLYHFFVCFSFLLLAFHDISICLTILNVVCCNTPIPCHLWEFIHVSSPKFEEATNLPMSCHTCWSRWYSSVIPQCSFHSSGSIPCRPSPRGVRNSERQKKTDRVVWVRLSWTERNVGYFQLWCEVHLQISDVKGWNLRFQHERICVAASSWPLGHER